MSLREAVRTRGKSASGTTASSIGVSAAQRAGFATTTTLATQASISLLNNKGDLGKTLDELGSSDSVKALVTAMVSLAYAKSQNDFASVDEQSGIQAGNGGFNINVKGNSDLKGGIITSTQAADAGKNSLSTSACPQSCVDAVVIHFVMMFPWLISCCERDQLPLLKT